MLTRATIVRIAHERPELRSRLVPILRKMAHGPIAFKDPDVMLYMIDPEGNHSKFYEMKIVPYGQETRAQRVKDLSRGNPAFVLQKRWGRLTDNPSTGRVDSENDLLGSQGGAETLMYGTRTEKVRKGYVDVSRTRKYPIGLGGAGFGWGGQAACRFTPEMKEMLGEVRVMRAHLEDFKALVAALQRKGSGIAPDLDNIVGEMALAMEHAFKFLSDELRECG